MVKVYRSLGCLPFFILYVILLVHTYMLYHVQHSRSSLHAPQVFIGYCHLTFYFIPVDWQFYNVQFLQLYY